jgi:hypothetical protein
MMREPTLLFEPIVEVRDVLESYLVDDVVLSDWRRTLDTAAARFLELGQSWSDTDVLELGRMTRQLAGDGLTSDAALARVAATMVVRLLEDARVPGVPRPEDDDWSF